MYRHVRSNRSIRLPVKDDPPTNLAVTNPSYIGQLREYDSTHSPCLIPRGLDFQPEIPPRRTSNAGGSERCTARNDYEFAQRVRLTLSAPDRTVDVFLNFYVHSDSCARLLKRAFVFFIGNIGNIMKLRHRLLMSQSQKRYRYHDSHHRRTQNKSPSAPATKMSLLLRNQVVAD